MMQRLLGGDPEMAKAHTSGTSKDKGFKCQAGLTVTAMDSMLRSEDNHSS